ncbi:MAG: hypothetical protein LAO24_03460 [Acidobacteriia bacterium]|nr:hypothetical protein [Terriglobia bacterium]
MKSLLRLLTVAVVSLSSCCLSARAAKVATSAASNQTEANAISSAGDGTLPAPSEFTIPGPLRSFLRMAGISQKTTPEEVLPLLSRNVFMQGYEGSSRQTEFLILLSRYVVQARELTALAATNGMVIRVSNCDDAKPLLRILGYRTRPNCGGPDTSLQTADPERAFLTIDSGFPLPELERTLQGGKPFEYAYTSSPVPVLFAEGDWTMASRKNYKETSRDLVDTILSDRAVARLYWALSKLDPETDRFLQRSIGIRKLLPYAAVLDFYGSHLCIREGRIIVPGGPGAESAWKDLVGVSPASPTAFVQRLLARDKGWLTAYFDVLSRVSRSQQEYFTEPHRLRSFYDALHSSDPSASATRGSFRPAPALLLLATRLQWEPTGDPLVPGNIEVWKDILHQKNNSHVSDSGRNTNLSSPDQLVQRLFALSRAKTDGGPLQIYMAISELDSRRSAGHRLAPATVRLLAGKFEEFSDQYRIFSECPELSDASITLFLDVAQTLNSLPNAVRGNALGNFQANVGIWQILARQGQISNLQLNDSWQQVIKPFARIRPAAQLYDAGRASLGELFRFATGKAKGSQDEIIELLAGPTQTSPEGKMMHQELAARIRSVLDGQRLVSLDTLLTLGDALSEKAQGKLPEEFVIHLAGELREFEMPRPIFTSGERTEWAPGIYNNHHTEVQMRTDIVKVLKSPTPSRAQLEDARGQLASFLRDTLVGLNYAYYEPPGAQALHNNPLFVRSHDFAAETVSGIENVWQAPQLLGQGSPAGGGAHFVGSLADLPYALAQLEQDFISPESVQALIWKELTPGLLTDAILPRWWDISQNELHAVALYQRTGEELLTASGSNEALRSRVMSILSDRVVPQQSEQVEQALRSGRVSEILPRMMPADTFYLTAEFQRRYPGEIGSWGAATQELQDLSRQYPDQVNWKRLSHDFGVPHPSMAQTYGRELLNVPPMPAFAGYSSRFLAESWDSPNLYWARLADERGYSAVALNRLVPELTRHMVEKIFASDFEDWPALLRAMHETGEDFRQGKLTAPPSVGTTRP